VPRSRSGCGGSATSTSSATSTAKYLARREAINAELAELGPEPIPDLDQARRVLDNFAIFWRTETDPGAKRQLLQLIFESVWLDDRRVVAVQPKPSFAPFFQERQQKRPGKRVGKQLPPRP
jgi:hypothetical protein